MAPNVFDFNEDNINKNKLHRCFCHVKEKIAGPVNNLQDR